MSGGLNTYLVVALGALHATPASRRQYGADRAARHERASACSPAAFLPDGPAITPWSPRRGLAVGGTVTALVGWFAFRRPYC